MVRARKAALVAAVCWGVVALWAPPASGATALTVTPNSDLGDENVDVQGSGFAANTSVGYCQAIQDTTPETSDCGGTLRLTTTDAAGNFADPAYPVRRFILVPSLGRTVDCALEACTIGAAEESDIAGTAAYAPISFDPALPDARIKNRADGSILGDNVYNTDATGQSRTRPVSPGSTWTFAVQVQNDGPAVDSFTIHSRASAPPFTVRYFSGYFNITSTVTGQGATLKNLSPGQVRTIAVEIRVAADAPAGARFIARVTFTSTSADRSDTVQVGVRIPTPT